MCWFVKDNNLEMFDFMAKVAKSKDLQAEYKKDPKALMQKEGLPEKFQDILLTQNREEFLSAIAGRH